ncbi:MAG: hypothetical protein ACYDAA_05185 [Syntrophales bacterium]
MTGRIPELNFFSLPCPMKVEATGATSRGCIDDAAGSGEAGRERLPV